MTNSGVCFENTLMREAQVTFVAFNARHYAVHIQMLSERILAYESNPAFLAMVRTANTLVLCLEDTKE